MERMPNSTTEDAGLVFVYQQVVAMGFVWRDFLRHDVGIDLVIEVIESGRATGLLVGVQVKSGASYFVGENARVYVPWSHLQYWLESSIPVLIVAYDPSRHCACWKAIEIVEAIKQEPAQVVTLKSKAIATSHSALLARYETSQQITAI